MTVDTLPRTLDLPEGEVTIRRFRPDDEAAMLSFARALPAHDLLFLSRDITHPKVIAAWLDEIADGGIHSLLALKGDEIVGCTAVVVDALSWSPHVGELRVLIAPKMRGSGLGRLLVQEAFAAALDLKLEKLVARMTTDQRGAIALFEELGFRGEALLSNHVRGRDGATHDVAILSHDVARVEAQLGLFGVGG